MDLLAKVIELADLVLLITDHATHDYAWLASQAHLIVDTRNTGGCRGSIFNLPDCAKES